MLLDIKHRLLLLDILPKEGNYVTLKVVRDQQGLLSFTEEELKHLKITREGDMYNWKEEDDFSVDIPIGEMAASIIKGALMKLDAEGQLKMEFLPFHEHFVSGEKWDGQ